MLAAAVNASVFLLTLAPKDASKTKVNNRLWKRGQLEADETRSSQSRRRCVYWRCTPGTEVAVSGHGVRVVPVMRLKLRVKKAAKPFVRLKHGGILRRNPWWARGGRDWRRNI